MITTFDQKLKTQIFRMSQLRLPVLLMLTLVVQFAIMALFTILWWKRVPDEFVSDNFIFKLLVIVIAGPLLETLIFQYAIIDYITGKQRQELLAILVSAFCFCLTHFFSLQYMVATFCSGIWFAFIFLVFRAKNSSAFLWTFVAHAAYNLFILIMRTITA